MQATQAALTPVPIWRRITDGIRAVRPLDLRTGHWFDRVLVRYLRARPARPVASGTVGHRHQKTCAIVRRNAAGAAVLGAATASLSTAGVVLTADMPWGGVVAVPLAACAMAAEMVARAVLHVRMSCALGDVWEKQFSPEDPADLARLYALAFDVEEPRDEATTGRSVIERLARARDGDLGNAIGAKLISETLLRNIVPFAGIATSALESWRLTLRVGEGVEQYLRFRRATDEPFARVAAHGADAVEALVEGVWLVAVADGQLDDHETALLAHLVGMCPRESRRKVTARFVDDEEGWLARLARLPEPAHDELFYALEVAAAMDGSPSPGERKLLAHAAAALDVELPPDRLDAIAAAICDGDGTPESAAAKERRDRG